MNDARTFRPEQAVEVARAFAAHGVEYLLIGKGALVLLGYPGMTQDVDVFARRSPENGRRIVAALAPLDFALSPEVQAEIVRGKDFVQLKTGPFDLDLIFAPDGISSFETADRRRLEFDGFRVANPRDIIASKRASGRRKDLAELPLLESFREEYERSHPQPLRRAQDITR